MVTDPSSEHSADTASFRSIFSLNKGRPTIAWVNYHYLPLRLQLLIPCEHCAGQCEIQCGKGRCGFSRPEVWLGSKTSLAIVIGIINRSSCYFVNHSALRCSGPSKLRMSRMRFVQNCTIVNRCALAWRTKYQCTSWKLNAAHYNCNSILCNIANRGIAVYSLIVKNNKNEN